MPLLSRPLFSRSGGEPATLASLGPLELRVLETLWTLPSSAGLARDVKDSMPQTAAYTTVTTTLDRLCRKGLLTREKVDRAFHYRARFTRRELHEKEARQAIQALAGKAQLVSCLVDAVSQYDPAMLDELEASIRRRREALRKS